MPNDGRVVVGGRWWNDGRCRCGGGGGGGGVVVMVVVVGGGGACGVVRWSVGGGAVVVRDGAVCVVTVD